MTVLTAVVILGRNQVDRTRLRVPRAIHGRFLRAWLHLLIGTRPPTLPETVLVILKSALYRATLPWAGSWGRACGRPCATHCARAVSNESGLGSAPIGRGRRRKRRTRPSGPGVSTGLLGHGRRLPHDRLVVVNSGAWQEGLRERTHAGRVFQLPFIGPAILTVGLLTFVFSTILGWSYYGEKACEYLFGARSIRPYRILWVIAVMVGSGVPP